MKFLTPQSIKCSFQQNSSNIWRQGQEYYREANVRIVNLRTYFASNTWYVLEHHRIYKKYLKPINLLIFICKNNALLAVNRAMNTLRAEDAGKSHWCFPSTAHVLVPRNADLDLWLLHSNISCSCFQLEVSEFLQISNGLLNFNSHRRTVTCLPTFFSSTDFSQNLEILESI